MSPSSRTPHDRSRSHPSDDGAMFPQQERRLTRSWDARCEMRAEIVRPGITMGLSGAESPGRCAMVQASEAGGLPRIAPIQVSKEDK